MTDFGFYQYCDENIHIKQGKLISFVLDGEIEDFCRRSGIKLEPDTSLTELGFRGYLFAGLSIIGCRSEEERNRLVGQEILLK